MKIPDILTDRPPRFSLSRLLFVAPFAAAAAGIAGTRYLLRRVARQTLPAESGRLRVDGLHADVEILRDRWGVPHIYAQNEHDLFFAQGFVHAQDRFFQMELNRRVGLGRLAEVLGPLGTTTDRFARIMGWPRAAAAGANLDSDTAVLTSAYIDGINAFIAQGNFSAEFALLAHKPAQWQLLDSTAWGVVLGWGLSVNWETEIMRARLIETLGPEKAHDLVPDYVNNYPTIVPDARVGERLATELLQAFRDMSAAMPPGVIPTGPNVGSNNWVLHGSRTTTGRPILANDPHLPPVFPALWYENHLHGGRFHVTGFTMPGFPGVIIGHNEHVAWGVTNAFPDVQDVYVERFHPRDPMKYEVNGRWQQAEVVEEVIKVRGLRSQTQTVRYTRHGPIITDLLAGEKRSLALRWPSYESHNHLRALFDINLATDWASFREALRHWGFPSQNIVFADKNNHIGYMMPGKVPRRRQGLGLVPVPGWTDDYEWDGWISHDELPQRFNPPEGVIVTANNKVTGSSYPHFLTGEWLAPQRAARIQALLAQAPKHSLRDNMRIQNDTISLLAQETVPLLLAQAPSETGREPLLGDVIMRLSQWDGDMRPDRPEPAIFTGWLVNFCRRALLQAVGESLTNELLGDGLVEGFTGYPFHKIVYELGRRWLAAPPPAWVGSIAPLIAPALLETIAWLEANCGPDPANWQWGKLHRLNLHNHLARIPALGQFWKPITMPIGGSGFTVNQADVTPHFPPAPVKLIASCRILIDVGAWDNSLSALPGGQSAHVASPHYQSGVAEWADGRYHPMLFSRDRVEAATVSTLFLTSVKTP